MTDQQAGWYQDPSGDASKLRYWNGSQWTNDFADANPVQGQAAYNPAGGQSVANPIYYQEPVQALSSTDQNVRLAAFIFSVIATISVCWAIIPLAWMVPMTIRSWGIYKGTKENTTAFGVCTLIFVSLVGGILLLVSKKD